MGSDVYNSSANGGQEEVVFQSRDIATKTKAGQQKEFFVKTKDKSFLGRLSDFFTKNKKKIFITMCALLLIAVAAIVAIKIIVEQNKPEEVEEVVVNYETIEDSRFEKRTEIEDYYNNSESSSAYQDTINHYVSEFESEEDFNKKFIIIASLGDFLLSSELYSEAENVYMMIDDNKLSSEQKLIYYRDLAYLYEQENDLEMAEYFRGELNKNLNGRDE